MGRAALPAIRLASDRVSGGQPAAAAACLAAVRRERSLPVWVGGQPVPVQVYLHVKQGRVSGLLGGHYYYHPEQHRLFELNRGATLDRDVYGERNRPIYDEAALCLFLVCPLDTVEASYGEWGYDMAMYEAG